MSAPVTLSLSRPIQAHGETVTELTFREPTAKDIIAAGFPFSVKTSGETATREFNMDSVAELISDLAAIPRPSVAQLSVLDFTRAMGAVLDFFNDPATQSG